MTIHEQVFTDEDGNVLCMESDVDSPQSPLQQSMFLRPGQTFGTNTTIFADPIKVKSKFNTTFAPSEGSERYTDPIYSSQISKE